MTTYEPRETAPSCDDGDKLLMRSVDAAAEEVLRQIDAAKHGRPRAVAIQRDDDENDLDLYLVVPEGGEPSEDQMNAFAARLGEEGITLDRGATPGTAPPTTG